MAIAAAFDFDVYQYDVKNAYINASLPIPIACQQPKGVVLLDHLDHATKIIVLRKALYRLPVSGLL